MFQAASTTKYEVLNFKPILERALMRKGSEQNLIKLLSPPLTSPQLTNDRYLAQMTRAINQAGFSWKVIDNKWPQFEEAYFNFNIKRLMFLPPEAWEAYGNDTRIVRNMQKIMPVYHNTIFIQDITENHGSFYNFLKTWPLDDHIGLLKFLKKHGTRLGGNTGQIFLRRIERDSFVTTRDVISALRDAGLHDLKPQPTAQKEFALIQKTFNEWHEKTGLCYTHLSQICAFSVGENHI